MTTLTKSPWITIFFILTSETWQILGHTCSPLRVLLFWGSCSWLPIVIHMYEQISTQGKNGRAISSDSWSFLSLYIPLSLLGNSTSFCLSRLPTLQLLNPGKLQALCIAQNLSPGSKLGQSLCSRAYLIYSFFLRYHNMKTMCSLIRNKLNGRCDDLCHISQKVLWVPGAPSLK